MIGVTGLLEGITSHTVLCTHEIVTGAVNIYYMFPCNDPMKTSVKLLISC